MRGSGAESTGVATILDREDLAGAIAGDVGEVSIEVGFEDS